MHGVAVFVTRATVLLHAEIIYSVCIMIACLLMQMVLSAELCNATCAGFCCQLLRVGPVALALHCAASGHAYIE
jgi:hypothetical protein